MQGIGFYVLATFVIELESYGLGQPVIGHHNTKGVLKESVDLESILLFESLLAYFYVTHPVETEGFQITIFLIDSHQVPAALTFFQSQRMHDTLVHFIFPEFMIMALQDTFLPYGL